MRSDEREIHNWLESWQACNDAADLTPDVRNSLHELHRLLFSALCPSIEADAVGRVDHGLEIASRGFVYLCTKCSGTTGDPLTHICSP